MPLHVLQLTDTHLFADDRQTAKGIPTNDSLRTVLAAVQAQPQRPDLILLTGDLSQDETAGSYEKLQAAIAPLGIPTYWLPGNHDRPELMRTLLQRPPLSGAKQIQQAGWQLLLLDSQVPGAVHGDLSETTLAQLAAQLENSPTTPTLIALHHPPLSVGSAWMDRIGLQNGATFQALLAQYPQVKAVIFGHIHQELDELRDGIRYLATPSTCVQFLPNSDEFGIDPDRAPGFRWLTLHPDGTVTTRVERVPYSVPLAIAEP